MRVLSVFAFPSHKAQNEKPLRKPHHALLIFLGAQLKICSTCLHAKFSSLQDFEMLYTLVWNSHWIINTRLQCKCLKTMQELKTRSVSASLVCTLGKVASEELQTASSRYIQHTAGPPGEQHCKGWCSGNERAESLGWTQKIQAWGGLQNAIRSTSMFVKTRKSPFPQTLPLEITFHPWNSAAYSWLFSGWCSSDGSAHTGSWHIPKHRKHKGSRDLVHHLEIKQSSQACLLRLWLTAAAQHMLGSAC